MTELHGRVEGEIKSHEHEMLEKIRKEKFDKRKKIVQELHSDWEKLVGDSTLAQHCVRKSLAQQLNLLENLLKKENSKPAKEVIQREIDKVYELLEIDAL